MEATKLVCKQGDICCCLKPKPTAQAQTHDNMHACLQLYINYKLKSVAALPWRQMTFKFLNTIIDDLFAFVIKMPWLHRLSVFRDDLVFLVYIYQRYAYRVDKKRPNEFGYASFPVYCCHSCYTMLYCICKCVSLPLLAISPAMLHGM